MSLFLDDSDDPVYPIKTDKPEIEYDRFQPYGHIQEQIERDRLAGRPEKYGIYKSQGYSDRDILKFVNEGLMYKWHYNKSRGWWREKPKPVKWEKPVGWRPGDWEPTEEFFSKTNPRRSSFDMSMEFLE